MSSALYNYTSTLLCCFVYLGPYISGANVTAKDVENRDSLSKG